MDPEVVHCDDEVPQSAAVPETTPLELTWRHCVDPVIPCKVKEFEIIKFVVEAVPETVIAVDEAYTKFEVDEALSPFWNQAMPVVAWLVAA